MNQFSSAIAVPTAQVSFPQQAVPTAQVSFPQQGSQFQIHANATVIPQQQAQAVNCETCPVPPTSQVTYTRQRIAVFGTPQIVSQDIDRCTGVPKSQVERVTAVFHTTPWQLDSGASVDPAYQQFVPTSFQSL